MGEMVEFPGTGGAASGYLATPDAGAGLALIVVQEQRGLVPHIKDVCDRFADEGFSALAPDLYHDETSTEPDEAGKLTAALNLRRAAAEIAGAVTWLLASDRTRGGRAGIVGFWVGGGLAWLAACDQPQAYAACVPFYGMIASADAEPDYARLEAAVQGHFAEHDPMFTPERVRALETRLRGMDKHVDLHVHPGTFDGFFNDTTPDVYEPDEARLAWTETLSFLREHLG